MIKYIKVTHIKTIETLIRKNIGNVDFPSFDDMLYILDMFNRASVATGDRIAVDVEVIKTMIKTVVNNYNCFENQQDAFNIITFLSSTIVSGAANVPDVYYAYFDMGAGNGNKIRCIKAFREFMRNPIFIQYFGQGNTGLKYAKYMVEDEFYFTLNEYLLNALRDLATEIGCVVKYTQSFSAVSDRVTFANAHDRYKHY